MTAASMGPAGSPPRGMDAAEWAVRVDLAACYRLAAHFGLTDLVYTHTTAGLAVAAQKHGLLPLTQHAMRFTGTLAYHDYEGIAIDVDEQFARPGRKAPANAWAALLRMPDRADASYRQ